MQKKNVLSTERVKNRHDVPVFLQKNRNFAAEEGNCPHHKHLCFQKPRCIVMGRRGWVAPPLPPHSTVYTRLRFPALHMTLLISPYTTMKKILFITQEILPYVKSSQMAIAGREIPQSVQENGYEIRTFMPRWGNINERRNQLHEVIRLSGLNIIVDDSDHPLIIKVASIQQARMQVYFIDNDDYFFKRQMLNDENGVEYPDNTERAVFYARGVLETVKKLRWAPDIIHCHGWISSIVPFFIKEAYADEPTFQNAKVVFSAYDEFPQLPPAENFPSAVSYRSATPKAIAPKGIDLTQPEAIAQMAVAFSDGLILSTQNDALKTFAQEQNVPLIECEGTKANTPAIIEFYNKVFGEE